MTKITYEEKMEYLEKRRQLLKGTMDMILKLHPEGDHRTEELQHKIDIIECIMEDIRDFKEVQPKKEYDPMDELFYKEK